MDNERLEIINRVIRSIDKIKLIKEFESSVNNFLKGTIEVPLSDQSNLTFEVDISPFYPFQYNNTESIKFYNEKLLPIPHVMKDGSLCLHTEHSPNIETKLHYDINTLLSWIEKYYIDKNKDTHYEHIIVNPSLVDDRYSSFQFTNVDYKLKKGDYGIVHYLQIREGLYNGKPIDNFMVTQFIHHNNKIECNWSKHYQQIDNLGQGLFYFVEKTPALYGKFAFTNWEEFSEIVSPQFLEYLYFFQINSNTQQSILPIFIGYRTVADEIHWIVSNENIKSLPIKGHKRKTKNGIEYRGNSWETVLVNQEIKWCLSENVSYQYFFGRGSFCESITESKILIIGVGAIGSMVAKTLTQCGAKNISITDFDTKEPGNICRSEYSHFNGYTNKTTELQEKLIQISPFVEVNVGDKGNLFGDTLKNVFNSQANIQNFSDIINEFDIVFNCSTDNDLMYILDKIRHQGQIINLSFTNHAKDLVCAFSPNIYRAVTFQFENILDNDTSIESMYNPTGCWSPTFQASYNDINLLVQYALKEINIIYKNNLQKNNFVLSCTEEPTFNIKKNQF